MTTAEALRVLDFTDAQHAKLWLDNRMIGVTAISLREGVFTVMELEAIAVLMKARQ